MSVLSIIAKLIPFVPRVVSAIRESGKRRTLDAPLGESEAARALRLEEQRRAEEQAKRTRLFRDDEKLCGACPNNYPLKAGEQCPMCGRTRV